MSARMPGWVQRLQRSTLAFPLAVLLGLAMLLVSELAYRGAIDQLESLLRLAHARMDTFVLLRRLTDAETYQRGYLITGHPQDRVRHQEAAADAAQRMLRLDSDLTTLGYTVKLHSRQRFLEAGERRLEEMREVVRLFDSGERSSAIELVRSGIGQDYMQQVRDSAEELIEVQNRHIRASLASTMDTLLASRLGIAGLTAACLGILGLFLHQSRLMARRQTEQKQALREERDRLEAEVQHRTRELTELARHLVSSAPGWPATCTTNWARC
jgi:CHASE3 domain sensor protein